MKRGRPSDFTPEVCDKIVQTLAAGHFRETAAKCAGVSVRAFRYWLAEGRRQKKGKYKDFLQSVQQAEHEAEIHCLDLVLQSEEISTKQWYLERRHPERWSPKRFDLIKIEKHMRDMEKTLQLIVEKYNITDVNHAK